MALQFRRGTEAERTQEQFTPLSGEPIYVTDTKRLYIGDGQTPGGNPVGFNNNLSDLEDVELQLEISIPILSINASANEVRITTKSAHGLATGDSIYVYSSSTPEINGLKEIRAVGISVIAFDQTIPDFLPRTDTGAIKYEPADKAILAYNQATGKWGEQSYVYRLADLGDVRITNPQADNILQYTDIPVGTIRNAQNQIIEQGVEEPATLPTGNTWTQTGVISKFINKAFEIDVNALTDVIINQSTLSNNQILAYDSFIEVWTNKDYVNELDDLADVSLNLPTTLESDYKVKLFGSFAENDTATVSVNGIPFSHVVTTANLDAAEQAAIADNANNVDPYIAAEIANALVALINANATLPVTATASGPNIILAADIPGDEFTFTASFVDSDTDDGFTPSVSIVEPNSNQVLAYDGAQWTNTGLQLNNFNLNTLNDVNLDNVTDGQILQYDSAISQWKNTDNFISLNQFADVAIVDPQPGEALIYNPDTEAFETRSFILDDLADVDDPSATQVIADGAILAYSEADQKWIPQQFSSLASRTEVIFNTGPLEDLEVTTVDFEAFTGYGLFKIQVSALSTVTLYVSAFERAADLAREEDEAPIPGQGIFAELTPPDLTYRRIAPVIYGYNDDTPITRAAYAKIRNRSGFYQSNIEVKLTILQIEEDPIQM